MAAALFCVLAAAVAATALFWRLGRPESVDCDHFRVRSAGAAAWDAEPETWREAA